MARRFVKRRRCCRSIAAASFVLALGMFLLMPGTTWADSITTYDFSGTVQVPNLFWSIFSQQATVTGQFTLDSTIGQVTSFEFMAPLFDVTPPNWVSFVTPYIPASGVGLDFVQFVFGSVNVGDNALILSFQTSLSAFDGSTFFNSVAEPAPGYLEESYLFCGIFTCQSLPGYTFRFLSGSATPTSTPEPSSLLLLGAGLFGLASRFPRRRT